MTNTSLNHKSSEGDFNLKDQELKLNDKSNNSYDNRSQSVENRTIDKQNITNKLTVKDYNINIDEMQKHINQLKIKEEIEKSRIEVTRKKIRKVMEVRKHASQKEHNRQAIKSLQDIEIETKRQNVRAMKEKDKITKITTKLALQQKYKDTLFVNKEMHEGIRQQRQISEKISQEHNREKREKIRLMSQMATHKTKAYQVLVHIKQEKERSMVEDKQHEAIVKKDERIKQLLETEEEMIYKLNKVRQAKKGIDRHYKDQLMGNRTNLMLTETDDKLDILDKQTPDKYTNNVTIGHLDQ